MKLDWNLMRTILAHVESETIRDFLEDAKGVEDWKEGQTLSERADRPQPAGVRVVLYHVKLLVDGGYLSGVIVRVTPDGFWNFGLSADPYLTLEGCTLLESLRTDGFVKRMQKFAKDKAVPLTLETLATVAGACVSAALA